MGSGWWRTAVVYQIYPRSFADADSDGVGDLAGITARLPYVAGLGVDAIWLTPFQRSPQADHGYDVSDYCDVDPLFGDLASFDTLLRTAHRLDLCVVVDLVPNHCSVEHPAFAAALAAGPGSPERARFHFRAGHGDRPPNNWPSVFGGPAWTRVPDGEWYLHLYAPEQPDWNWDDPRTHEFFDGVLRFWYDRGVDGVRIDVAHGLYKAAGLPDLDDPAGVEPMRLRANPLACDREEVHAVYRRWRALAEGYPEPRVLIGEVNLAPDRAARYTRPDELHQAFAFAFLTAPWDAETWRDTAAVLLASTGAPVTWVVENHDVVRASTRYGGEARARAALLFALGLPGAAYLYQGQELGLPEVDVPPDRRRDPAWVRCGQSRDGARVPLPWTRDPVGAHGFSTVEAEPWLPVPAGWGDRSVEAQDGDPDSTLTLTRRALAERRRLAAAGLGETVRWDVTAGVLTAARAGLTVVVNLSARPVPLPPGSVLVASGPVGPGLPPDTAVWLAPLRR